MRGGGHGGQRSGKAGRLAALCGVLLLGCGAYFAVRSAAPAGSRSPWEEGLPPRIGEPSSYASPDTPAGCSEARCDGAGRAALSILNSGRSELEIGVDFALETERQGVWYTLLPYREEMLWPAAARVIPAGESISAEYDLTAWGRLEAGRYRLILSSGLLASEFQIE